MCGIVVVVGGDDPGGGILRALHEIRHRGSTGPEVQNIGKVSIGATRLPITTLQHEVQPSTSPSGRYVVVCNGEFYDEDVAHFSNDTEYLVNEIERRGVNCLQDMNSAHAVIIYDRNEEMIYLCRDHIGIKPLYYSFDGKSLRASSEIKGIIACSDKEDIHSVGAGEVVRFSIVGMSLESHAQVEFPVTNPQLEGSVEELRALIEDSVRVRCRNLPGPVGVFFSGGVDSSAVLALVAKERSDVIAIVGGSPGDLDYQAAMSMSLCTGIDVINIPVKSEIELFGDVEDVVRITESFEPNMIRQSAVQMCVARAASEMGCKVVFCGEGADELFCGYPEFGDLTDKRVLELRNRFIADLHCTQLQRVDRLTMNFTTEARVPILDRRIVAHALNLRKVTNLINKTPNNGYSNKVIFREALKGLVPEENRTREKVVLSEGMGHRGNDPKFGLFAQLAERELDDGAFRKIQLENEAWGLRSKEEAYYFSIFKSLKYDRAGFLKNRPMTNIVHSVR